MFDATRTRERRIGGLQAGISATEVVHLLNCCISTVFHQCELLGQKSLLMTVPEMAATSDAHAIAQIGLLSSGTCENRSNLPVK